MPMITWLQLIALPWSTSSTYLHYYLSILLFHITPHYITIVTCPVYLFCSARTSEHSMPLSKPTFLSKVYLFHQRPRISPPLPANPSTGNLLFACECASRVFFLSMSQVICCCGYVRSRTFGDTKRYVCAAHADTYDG
ncbi:hypothetical protein F4823DRAFT_576384 [Ustulina deusta]|nr:hypothetical protein F4823DRAFT_576384 [Ustulina deusta]